MVQLSTCVDLTVHNVYGTLCLYFALAFTLFHSKILLFGCSLSNCLGTDYSQLLLFLCIILILEMYSKYFDPVDKKLYPLNYPVVQYHHQLSKSINIILHNKNCTWSQLSIGFSKAYGHYSPEIKYTEPISPTGVEVGETIASSFSPVLLTLKLSLWQAPHPESYMKACMH